MSESLAATSSPALSVTGLSSSPANASESANNSSFNKMLDNLEDVLLELNSFEKEISKAASLVDLTIPATLDSYLKLVAQAGTTQFPWNKIKPLFRVKLEQVIHEFNTRSPTTEIPPAPNVDPFNFDAVKVKVFEQLDTFIGIPFTVQRLAELVTQPNKHYKRTDKFMRALEKNMLVVTTIEARETANDASASATEAAPSGSTYSLTNGSDHNVLPVPSVSSVRRAQSPTPSGFVKSSKLSDKNEKEAEAKPKEDDSMDTSEKSKDESSKDESSNDESPSNEDMSTDEKSSNLDLNKNPDSSEPGNSEPADEESEAKIDMETEETSQGSCDEPSTSEDGNASDDVTNKQTPQSGDDASSSSDVTQESADDSSKEVESVEPKSTEPESVEASVATTSEDGDQTQKPDEGEPSVDDGGPCDSADSNQPVSSASLPQTSEVIPTETQVGSSETHPVSDCESSTETKDIATDAAPVADQSSAEPSKEQESTPTPSESTDAEKESSPDDDSMDVDAECTSSETQIHTST